VLENGKRLLGINVVPGMLKDLQMFPSDYRVQKVSDLTVAFRVMN